MAAIPTKTGRSSDRLWRANSLNLNIPILKRLSTPSIKAATVDEETELERLWLPSQDKNALNLNIPNRDRSLGLLELHQDSSFGKDKSGDGDPSKLLEESLGVEKPDTLLGFLLVLVLVGIDQTVIVTALPIIASDFNEVADLSWIAGAFYLTEAGSILLFGKIITVSSAKWTLLVSIALFEIGSLCSALAHSVNFLIFGRAMSGVGAAGIWITQNAILPKISTLEQRPLLVNLLGLVFALCSIIGPLFGGAFVDINLPIGAVGTAVIIFSLPHNISCTSNSTVYSPIGVAKTSLQRFLRKHDKLNTWLALDWIGIFLNFAAVTLLFVGLQTGGNTKPWSDGGVIAPLVLSILLFISFGFWENHRGSRGIMPIALLKRRNILGACVQQYFLPLLYQLRGHSAEKSGLDILWCMIAGVIASIISSGITTATGIIWPFMCFPQTITVVAYGLLSNTKPDTSFARIAGFQILIGAGLGFGINGPVLIAQADLMDDPEAAALATTLVIFSEFLISGINQAANGAIFAGILHSQVSKLAGDLPANLREQALESITFTLHLPDNFKGRVIEAYINAIDRAFLANVVPTAISVFTAFIIERKKIAVPKAK
ncbi:hypothetical protein Clacol_007100 [Clathrus columnatus]|uniref:Major facilitator superfamily (MFS) profile domain-containing protein n=1 Tax=Clathrus columnatus TaxID=1419009 RepID=A0AAV5AF23_9AGAM|nr:hypothetical protein Clacol_007100 [Clathrus columnatus]